MDRTGAGFMLASHDAPASWWTVNSRASPSSSQHCILSYLSVIDHQSESPRDCGSLRYASSSSVGRRSELPYRDPGPPLGPGNRSQSGVWYAERDFPLSDSAGVGRRGVLLNSSGYSRRVDRNTRDCNGLWARNGQLSPLDQYGTGDKSKEWPSWAIQCRSRAPRAQTVLRSETVRQFLEPV